MYENETKDANPHVRPRSLAAPEPATVLQELTSAKSRITELELALTQHNERLSGDVYHLAKVLGTDLPSMRPEAPAGRY